ncbi:MAG: NAD-dependent epimerase/dehydratase family protein [Rhodospirillaceae bacterium]
MNKRVLIITGAGGLIGSEVAVALAGDYDVVVGIDNNQRKVFFGSAGDTTWRRAEVENLVPNYRHVSLDIRDRSAVLDLIQDVMPTDIVHCAAQPSHDLAAKIPFDDFDVNAVGTLNLLEAFRRRASKGSFVYLSTNKVYGDGPNAIKLRELDTRYDYADAAFAYGIPETFSIDQCLHSLFGASKVAADVIVQEYGRYFGINTCCLRGGCLTGPNHSGVQLHGFLNYLVKANIERRKYIVFGYKGKQVRDNIHSRDVANFIRHFLAKPRVGEVYNIGGGKENSISILEAFNVVSGISGIDMEYEYSDQARIGDHICYYSDLRKMVSHYPEWQITTSVKETIAEIVEAAARRKAE